MVTGGLSVAEQYLFISSLAFAGAIHQIFKEELVVTPGVRQYCIWWYHSPDKVRRGQLPGTVEVKKSHCHGDAQGARTDVGKRAASGQFGGGLYEMPEYRRRKQHSNSSGW